MFAVDLEEKNDDGDGDCGGRGESDDDVYDEHFVLQCCVFRHLNRQTNLFP